MGLFWGTSALSLCPATLLRLYIRLSLTDASYNPVLGRAQVRLLMCYAATHPDKLDSAKLAQWQKLAKLSDADIATLTNLECLGVPVLKRSKPGRLAGLVRKRNRAVRKVRRMAPLLS